MSRFYLSHDDLRSRVVLKGGTHVYVDHIPGIGDSRSSLLLTKILLARCCLYRVGNESYINLFVPRTFVTRVLTR